MNLDVVILAGGRGTRLAGVWDGPKCLVPVAGRSVLQRLLEEAGRLSPRRIILSLGYRANEVVRTLAERRVGYAPVLISYDNDLSGTTQALRHTLLHARFPLLVLNGDTLPGYGLAGLVLHDERSELTESSVAWCRGQYAGAAFLNGPFAQRLLTESDAQNLETLLLSLPRYYVEEYLDVGTPERFSYATSLKEYP